MIFINSRKTMPILVMGLTLALPGCTGSLHRKWADREVFGILRSKASTVPNSGDGLFNITPPGPVSLAKLARSTKPGEFLGDRAFIEQDARLITLADALQYGVERNRSYLGQKEDVYLTALDLTGVRHDFALIPTATGTGNYNLKRDALNKVVTNRTLTAHGDVGFSMLQNTGAVLASNLVGDFMHLITGKLTGARNSALVATLSQPLLKGAGSLSVTEPLTQAERDTLYAIRDFTQYRKTFCINVTTQYYQTLQARFTARNSYLAFQAFKKLIELQAALTDANRPGRTKTALGLIKQAQFTYNRNWLNAVKSYEAALDDLKLTLGLPVTEHIVLDQSELDKLALIQPPGNLDEATKTAMTTRLDLWNQRDTLVDTERKVRIAKQNLLPTLNGVLKYNSPSDPTSNTIKIDSRRHELNAGLDVDLHLDQKPARNDLRSAEIAEQKARRAVDLAEENVRRDLRISWRALELARNQLELAEASVKLNTERLALEEGLDKEGVGQARDLIDAQTALIQANDDRIAALVNHTIARIQMWKDMGILYIKKDGKWEDVLLKEGSQGKHD